MAAPAARASVAGTYPIEIHRLTNHDPNDEVAFGIDRRSVLTNPDP